MTPLRTRLIIPPAASALASIATALIVLAGLAPSSIFARGIRVDEPGSTTNPCQLANWSPNTDPYAGSISFSPAGTAGATLVTCGPIGSADNGLDANSIFSTNLSAPYGIELNEYYQAVIGAPPYYPFAPNSPFLATGGESYNWISSSGQMIAQVFVWTFQQSGELEIELNNWCANATSGSAAPSFTILGVTYSGGCNSSTNDIVFEGNFPDPPTNAVAYVNDATVSRYGLVNQEVNGGPIFGAPLPEDWTVSLSVPPAYTYQIIKYPNPPVPSNPCIGAYGINDSGHVVGYECSSGKGVPFIWHNGTFAKLPANPLEGPGGTFPLSISDSGQIVGYFLDGAGKQHGFLFTPNASPRYVQIDHPSPASGTFLAGISLTAGIRHGVPGFYASSGNFVATIYDSGRQVIDTETPPDTWQDFNGATDPVNGAYNSIVAPSGGASEAIGINASGAIAGRRGAPFQDSFVYIGGTNIGGVCPLLTSPAPAADCNAPRFTPFSYMSYPTHAWAINDNGDVAGWFNDPRNGNYGQSFVRSGPSGAINVVNVAGTDPTTGIYYPSFISTALGINNRGVIVGDAYSQSTWYSPPNTNGDGAVFFIATPVTEGTAILSATFVSDSIDANGNYSVEIIITNTGNALAPAASLVSAELVTTSRGTSVTTPTSSALPAALTPPQASLANGLLPGESAISTLTFPASAGSSGSVAELHWRSTYFTGAAKGRLRLVLP